MEVYNENKTGHTNTALHSQLPNIKIPKQVSTTNVRKDSHIQKTGHNLTSVGEDVE